MAMFERTILRGRTIDLSGSIYQADGVTGVAAEATDVIRFKLYRRDNDTPVLDIDNSATVNGSVTTITTLTAPAVYVIRLAQADLSGLEPGVYGAEIALVDDSETAPANAIKNITTGSITVRPSPGGDIGQ